jgi:hypothetical protein
MKNIFITVFIAGMSLLTARAEPNFYQCEQAVRAGAADDTSGYRCISQHFRPDPSDPDGGTFFAYYEKHAWGKLYELGFAMDVKTKKVTTILNAAY